MNNLTATVNFEREECIDESPDLSWLDQERLEAYKRGDWHTIGIRAVATVTIHDAVNRCTHQHKLTSCGLWGIESDSGEEYLASVFAEEREQLRADIQAMGGAA